jgi:hypothetical protein
MDGTRLVEILIEGTGLPREVIYSEINRLVTEKGLSVEQITMDDLREIVASYLQDTLLEAKSATGGL